MRGRASGEDKRLPSPTSALPINERRHPGRRGSLSLPLFQVNGSETLLIGEQRVPTLSSKKWTYMEQCGGSASLRELSETANVWTISNEAEAYQQ